MSNDYASLVLLTYKRPDFTDRTLTSLKAAKNHTPYELIVVDDGSRDGNWPMLLSALREREISSLVVNAGENMGVGVGINRGFMLGRGKYLVKLDADLLFKPGWLDAGAELLEAREDIATVGFFDYLNYVPGDTRFNHLEPIMVNGVQKGWIVDDYVGSAFMLRRRDYLKFGVENVRYNDWEDAHPQLTGEPRFVGFEEGSAAFAEDVAWKRKMTDLGFKHAITAPDYIHNFGFGVGNSTVVPSLDAEGKAVVQTISQQPLVFPGGARA